MDENIKAYQATSPVKLREQIMDSRVAKTEREWWASREIEKLEKELGEYKRDEGPLLEHEEQQKRKIERLETENAKLTADYANSQEEITHMKELRRVNEKLIAGLFNNIEGPNGWQEEKAELTAEGDKYFKAMERSEEQYQDILARNEELVDYVGKLKAVAEAASAYCQCQCGDEYDPIKNMRKALAALGKT